MEEILKYENRDQLYQSLIADLGLIKIEEKYDNESFGNWFVTLAAKNFFITYVNDRSFLTITIQSKLNETECLDLSFVEDLIYDPEHMNDRGIVDNNVVRIGKLNKFLRKDFEKISELYSPSNYANTITQIKYLCKETFKRRFPGKVRE